MTTLESILKTAAAFSREPVAAETPLWSLGDGATPYEVLIAVGDLFELEFTDAEAEATHTLADLARLVEARTGEIQGEAA